MPRARIARDVIHALLSSVPWLRQDALIVISPAEVRGENLESGSIASIARSVSHPRTLIGDFYALSNELKSVCSSILPRSWIAPNLLICLQGQDDGGYTNIELRAVREAAHMAGARNSWLSIKLVSASQARDVLRSSPSLDVST